MEGGNLRVVWKGDYITTGLYRRLCSCETTASQLEGSKEGTRCVLLLLDLLTYYRYTPFYISFSILSTRLSTRLFLSIKLVNSTWSQNYKLRGLIRFFS